MERISDWHHALAAAGARTDDSGIVTDFGDPAAEAQAAGASAVVVPLTGSGLISATGPDAASFLNSQLTSDVTAVSSNRAQYTGYCTPKGRLLATMLLFTQIDRFWLSLPAALAATIAQRLQKFVLRARVKLDVASADMAMFGVTGPQSNARLTEALGGPAAGAFEIRCDSGTSLITLPGNRFLVVCTADQVGATWLKLSASLCPAGWNWWHLQTIRSGIATVTIPTQEAFVPQMLALDAYDAVSFSKGCYPGQEIVARTRYLGDLKRHLYYGRGSGSLGAGDTIVDESTGLALGTVTDAAENADHFWEFLAVLQREAVNAGPRLRSKRGDAVTVESRVADVHAGGGE